ncbi:MAG: ribosomal-processing cysteine protease Prp [Clostridia bacterium]|nr:ribosomal-processing cysteine protease Prp [Clostridia bacterium]
MITVDVYPGAAIRIGGHAGFAPYGSDIVCAAASALAGALAKLGKTKAMPESVLIIGQGLVFRRALTAHTDALCEIEKQYPTHLEVKIHGKHELGPVRAHGRRRRKNAKAHPDLSVPAERAASVLAESRGDGQPGNRFPAEP